MKSLRKKTEAPRNVPPGILRRGIKKLKFGLMACAAAGTFACAAPLVDKARKAKPQPVKVEKPLWLYSADSPFKSDKPLRWLYSVDGILTTLTYANKKRTVYFVTDTTQPLVLVKAPAEIILDFYPIMFNDRFAPAAKNIPRSSSVFSEVTIFAGWPRKDAIWSKYQGKTRESNIKHPAVPSKSVVGTPLRITVRLGVPPEKDRQTFGVTGPKGFLEVVSVKPFEHVTGGVGYRRPRRYWAPSPGVKPVHLPARTGYRKRRRYFAPSAR